VFVITPDQEYILDILRKTRVMRTDQAAKLLSVIDAGKSEQYTARLLNQLQHMQKIAWKTDSLFTTPLLYKAPVDDEMLSAVDIMADLTDYRVASLSSYSKPYKLCFYTEQGDSIGSYAVIFVSPGDEMKITAALHDADKDDRTIIFLSSEPIQREIIKTSLPHFFAIRDNGKYRYYEGGK